MKARMYTKVSNLTLANGGCSTLRVGSFWSLLAFGRSLFDTLSPFVSCSFDIVIVGCRVESLAPYDITFEH